jgi:ribosome assembly protein YihI (activator of Der GTPase)
MNMLPVLGHALNKLLKDFINRYKTIKGHRVRFVMSVLLRIQRLMNSTGISPDGIVMDSQSNTRP